MQWPPMPGPGVNFMKPKGFVAAASMTSQTLTPSLSQTIAISFTRPMLTERKVFSSSLTSSAVSVPAARCAAPYFGGVLCVPDRVAGINPLRAEGEKHLLTNGQPRRLELRLQQLPSRARISCALEYHHYSRPAVAPDGISSRENEAHVGITRLREGRRHGNGNSVHLLHPLLVGSRLELSRFNQAPELRAGDVLDVRLSLHQRFHHALTDVVADNLEARLRELQREWQAHIAQADDANAGRSVLNFG